jgi:hypothetical protein
MKLGTGFSLSLIQSLNTVGPQLLMSSLNICNLNIGKAPVMCVGTPLERCEHY